MRIKKIINNNILCAVDEKGQELIVTGKGIGFKRFPGEFVDMNCIEKVYRMEGKTEQKKLRELVEKIPLEHLQLTEELVEYVKREVSGKLNESLLITLSDHISFAILREEKGIEYKNPLSGPVMCYYPEEYRLEKHCLQMIEERCHVNLNEDEATFIALHIVNAELNTSMSQMYDITRMLDGCIRVVEFYYRRKWDEDSVDFSRFVVHLRYLIFRMFRDGREEHQKKADSKKDRKTEERDELIYLTIHLKRLNTEDEGL